MNSIIMCVIITLNALSLSYNSAHVKFVKITKIFTNLASILGKEGESSSRFSMLTCSMASKKKY